jgi:hypothetical protein
MEKNIVLMEQVAARLGMEAMVAVIILRVFVVKTGFTVAPMQRLAVPILVVVFFLMLFVANLAVVARMEPIVLTMGPVLDQIFSML